jgi:hypothetical protein
MYYNLEKAAQGQLDPLLQQGGYVNTPEYAPTLHAFTHYAYHVSGGLILMVTNLQGVLLKERGAAERQGFLLTDPAIHCTDVERFRRTNLGKYGFDFFFRSHSCNVVCRALGLPNRRG